MNIHNLKNLALWTVYDHPTDFPDYFIARRFNFTKVTQDYIADKSLKIVRDYLRHKGLFCIPRHADDDPFIVEIWV